jgi:hypothetical protein
VKRWALIPMAMLMGSCQWFEAEEQPEAVARVGDEYLYQSDVSGWIESGLPQADSLALVRASIDKWATQRLLMTAAEVNLSNARKAELDELIRQYKTDLYTRAYLDDVVRTKVDTVVTDEELKSFYEANRENFRTSDKLVKVRYIHMAGEQPGYANIRSKFLDFRKSDQKFWDSRTMHFKSYAFNDSVWVEAGALYQRLPFLNQENRDRYLVSGKASEIKDSTDVYLLKVVGVIDRNQIGPYEYMRPTLKDVILNQRKLALIKTLEKDITQDAIKDKKYEIFR